MALPNPEPGLVICYSYLWRHEKNRGREEGVKDRPCVIVLTHTRSSDNREVVTVVPVTHTRPKDNEIAIALPPRVKAALGLDSEPSWIVIDEVNRFVWPGYDVRPIGRGRTAIAYGFLPPRLFADVAERLAALARVRRVSIVARD